MLTRSICRGSRTYIMQLDFDYAELVAATLRCDAQQESQPEYQPESQPILAQLNAVATRHRPVSDRIGPILPTMNQHN